jgi:dTDP-4-dehydrorhamnose 3,5-epimerase
LWKDPTLGIDWPLEGEPCLAAKDVEGKLFREVEVFK